MYLKYDHVVNTLIHHCTIGLNSHGSCVWNSDNTDKESDVTQASRF